MTTAMIAALWLTLKLPFTLVVNGERFEITHNEVSRNHGGWTQVQKCGHCGKDNVVSFDLTDCDVVNLKDLTK